MPNAVKIGNQDKRTEFAGYVQFSFEKQGGGQ